MVTSWMQQQVKEISFDLDYERQRQDACCQVMVTCADVEMENGVSAATYVVVEIGSVAVEKEIVVDVVMGSVVCVVIGSHDDVSQKATFLSLSMTGRDLFP